MTILINILYFIKYYLKFKYIKLTQILIVKSSEAENKKYYSLTKLVIESVCPFLILIFFL